jgi:lysophospholipase L1-like esterase
MRLALLSLLAILICAASSVTSRADEPAAKLPKIVLLGDSIRMSYTPYVTKELASKAVIVSNKANGGDSAKEVAQLTQWAIKEQPDIVHFNAGIHDIKKFKKTGKYQVSPEQYAANLRTIVERLRKETKAVVIFATTTPIIDDRAAKTREKVEYELLDASTVEYNGIARQVMEEFKVPVNDLRAALGDADEQRKLISADGVHFSPAGVNKLGAAVVTAINERLGKK